MLRIEFSQDKKSRPFKYLRRYNINIQRHPKPPPRTYHEATLGSLVLIERWQRAKTDMGVAEGFVAYGDVYARRIVA